MHVHVRQITQTPLMPTSRPHPQGFLDVGAGNERVVLKRVKQRVHGADEMVQMEHLINVGGA